MEKRKVKSFIGYAGWTLFLMFAGLVWILIPIIVTKVTSANGGNDLPETIQNVLMYVGYAILALGFIGNAALDVLILLKNEWTESMNSKKLILAVPALILFPLTITFFILEYKSHLEDERQSLRRVGTSPNQAPNANRTNVGVAPVIGQQPGVQQQGVNPMMSNQQTQSYNPTSMLATNPTGALSTNPTQQLGVQQQATTQTSQATNPTSALSTNPTQQLGVQQQAATQTAQATNPTSALSTNPTQQLGVQQQSATQTAQVNPTQQSTTPTYNPTAQQPTYKQPTYQQPTYQQPTYQQPMYTQPLMQQPTYQQPTYQQPVYQQPMYTQQLYQQPYYQQQYPQQYAYGQQPNPQQQQQPNPNLQNQTTNNNNNNGQ